MKTQKTTVYLDEADYRRLKAIGREIRRSPAALVRERLRPAAIATLDLRHFGAVPIRGNPRLFPRDLR